LKGQLLECGFEETPSAGDCDVAVLNTCTVTAAADAEVRQVIRRILRGNRRCRVLVTGCYAQRAPEEIAGLEGVAWVVGNSHKHTIGELLSHVGGAEAEVASESQGAALLEIQKVPSPAKGEASRVLVGEIAPDFHF